MKQPNWLDLHPDFQLNGIAYTTEDLNEIGYSLIKEGEPYEAAMGDFILDWISPKEYVKVFTSGSTGVPKAITIQKEWMINSAKATGEYFQLGGGDKALLCLPCSSIAGKMMLVRAMILGLHLDYVEASSKPLAQTDKRYDFAAMVPMQAENSLKQLSQIKKLIIGGAPIHTALRNQLLQQKNAVYETYGMTETVSHVAIKKLDKEIESFTVLPSVRISIDDKSCLVIVAHHLSKGKVATNDLVEIEDEKHFKWLGRHDSVVNSGGVKLIPEQIERKLSAIIKNRFFVAGMPDKTLGEQLVLIVEDSDCDKEVLAKKMRKLNTLARYELPKKIFCVGSFFETKTGKIHRSKNLSQIP